MWFIAARTLSRAAYPFGDCQPRLHHKHQQLLALLLSPDRVLLRSTGWPTTHGNPPASVECMSSHTQFQFCFLTVLTLLHLLMDCLFKRQNLSNHPYPPKPHTPKEVVVEHQRTYTPNKTQPLWTLSRFFKKQ